MRIRELLTTWNFDVDFKALKAMEDRIGEVKEQTKDVAKNFKELSVGVRNAGAKISAFVTLPLSALAISALNVAGDFEKSMNRVAALTGETGEMFDKLTEQAKDLGGSTQFSASQAADAMGFLAQAGFNVNEIYEVMPATLNLAGAAQLGMAESADIVSNIMRGMGLETKDLNNVVDVLSKAFTASNTNLSDLGQAMKYAGPVAAGFNVSLEDTVALLGLMGNAGIQASMAGTSLRGALTRLANPTKEIKTILDGLGISTLTSNNEIRNIVDILKDLEKQGATTADIMSIFGDRAGPAIVALLEGGIAKVDEFSLALKNAGGTAERIQKIQLRGLNGAIEELKSAWESVQIAFAETGITNFVTDFVKAIANLLGWISKTNKTVLSFITILATLIAIIGPILLAVGSLGIALSGIAQGFAVFRSVMLAASAAGMAFNASMLLIPAAIVLILAIIGLFINDLINFGAGNKSLIGELISGWGAFGEFFSNLWSQISNTISAMINGIGKAAGVIGGLFGKLFGDASTSIDVTRNVASSTNPVAALPRPAGSGSVSKNNNVNVDSTINLQVPQGTSEQQKTFLQDAAKQSFDEMYNSQLRQAFNEFAEVS